MAEELDGLVAACRSRPLDGGPYVYVWIDAHSRRCRDGGRVVNVATVTAIGVNASGHREVLGCDVITSEDGAGWTAFLRDLVARGLTGVKLVVSDDHKGSVALRCRGRARPDAGALATNRGSRSPGGA